ncbi:hypothetical protein HNP87_000725 [Methanococcus maripaludis]|uniref:Uncharacterized protein n=1 Tax=Methanococcus maripaludis TaxID=39152 RepID=A0A7J9S3I2_METMI|nr:hypothetical protein [Methanococcus maripaludis]MBA2859925.1 hypothetical protein [Methanococcus maripaludis]MBA2868566.1 hypothetical protein [Methanococcus maripaludis]MBB6400830.1 hypothetical protein [Methanococcus maripaludis]
MTYGSEQSETKVESSCKLSSFECVVLFQWWH